MKRNLGCKEILKIHASLLFHGTVSTKLLLIIYKSNIFQNEL